MTTTAPAAAPSRGGPDLRSRPRRARAWRLPLALTALGAVLHLGLVWLQSPQFLLRVDDSYYYFQIARNAAAGHGFSFDGIHATNGFQPLWGMILAAAAWVLARVGVTEPMLLARLFLSLAALVNLAAGLALYAAVRAWLGRRRDALGVLAVWLLSPVLVAQQTAGMENALFALVLAGSLAAYHHGFRDADRPPSPAQAAALGALLGLLGITRLDAALLAAVAIPVIAWRMRRMPLRTAAARLAPLCVLAALPVAIYLALNLARFGQVMPIAGAAKEWYAAKAVDAVGGPWSPGHLRMLAENVFITLLRLVYAAAGPILLAYGWLHPLYGMLLGRAGAPLMIAAPAASGAAAAVLAAWIAAGRGAARVLRARLCPLVRPGVLQVFALLHFSAFVVLYPIYLRGPGVAWYFVPLYLLMVTGMGVAGAFAVQWLRARLPRLRRWIGPAAVAALALNFVLYLAREARPELVTSKLEVVAWANENLPADARVGSFNAGAIGFFAERPVINLDGLVNDADYLDHLRSGRIEAYARREGITHVIEYATSAQTPQGRWHDLPVGRVLLARPFHGSRTVYFVVELPWATQVGARP
jgi:hypothetical protein